MTNAPLVYNNPIVSSSSNRERADSGSTDSSSDSSGNSKSKISSRRRSHRPRGCRGGSNRKKRNNKQVAPTPTESNVNGDQNVAPILTSSAKESESILENVVSKTKLKSHQQMLTHLVAIQEIESSPQENNISDENCGLSTNNSISQKSLHHHGTNTSAPLASNSTVYTNHHQHQQPSGFTLSTYHSMEEKTPHFLQHKNPAIFYQQQQHLQQQFLQQHKQRQRHQQQQQQPQQNLPEKESYHRTKELLPSPTLRYPTKSMVDARCSSLTLPLATADPTYSVQYPMPPPHPSSSYVANRMTSKKSHSLLPPLVGQGGNPYSLQARRHGVHATLNNNRNKDNTFHNVVPGLSYDKDFPAFEGSTRNNNSNDAATARVTMPATIPENMGNIGNTAGPQYNNNTASSNTNNSMLHSSGSSNNNNMNQVVSTKENNSHGYVAVMDNHGYGNHPPKTPDIKKTEKYRHQRIEKQQRHMMEGGSLFATSPRSFLMGHWKQAINTRS